MATAIDLPPPGFYDDEQPSNDDARSPTRVPPHDHDAEEAVLAEVMCDPASVERAVELGLLPEHFESESHRQWWSACVEVRASGRPVEVLTVKGWLERTDRLAQVGRDHMADVIGRRRFPTRLEAWVELVRDAFRARKIITCCQRVEALGYNGAGGQVLLEELAKLQADAAGPAPKAAPPWAEKATTAPAPWWESPPPARAWLLRDARRQKADGLLPLGKVAQLISEGGAGKTMALFQLAVAIATMTRWLGAFDVAIPGADGRPRRGRVLLVVGEEDAEEAHRRCYRARRATGAPVPAEGSIVVLPLAGIPCPMLERDERGNLLDTAFLEWFRSWVQANGPWDLIVFDPLSRFAGPDAEVDNAAATRFVQALESIASLTGATVLVAHHTNKLARRGGSLDSVAGRGSSALVDGVRWVAALGVERLEIDDPDERARLGELVTWSHTKSNYSRRAEDLLLRHDHENGGALVPLDEVDLEIVGRTRNGEVERERKEQAKDDERERRVLKDAAAVARYVHEHPACRVTDARRIVLADNSRRWTPALAKLAGALDQADGLRIDLTKLPTEVRQWLRM